MDRNKIKAVQASVLAALKTVEEKYSVSFSFGSGRFGHGYAHLKLSVVEEGQPETFTDTQVHAGLATPGSVLWSKDPDLGTFGLIRVVDRRRTRYAFEFIGYEEAGVYNAPFQNCHFFNPTTKQPAI